MYLKKEYKLIYYKDNGSLPPEYHQELIIKIHYDGTLKIKKLKGYEDQILFQYKGILQEKDLEMIQNLIEQIDFKENRILNFNPDKFGGPLEYIELFYKNKIIKWHYPDILKDQDQIFYEIYKIINHIYQTFAK
ncbi:MAG: hypothetical protein KatS3mg129_0154 [Leptospiraceae bacterium]|nr:MAG: hypothetical protein KatS3mg129_0154 [Leptospiraceae bacterium]